MISNPLTELLKKDNFKWTDDATNAFERLKQAMNSAPVLALPDFSKSFVVEADACDKGIGAVLMQEHRPIAYLNKALSPRNQGLSVYEKEFLAILQAVHKWKHYLVGHYFIIKTDHQSLKHILEQKVDNVIQQKWISKLLGLDYEVQYKKEKDNIAVDALSRRDHGECATITVIIPNWVMVIQKSYEQDDELLTIMQAKTVKDTSFPAYTLQGGILRRNQRICMRKSTTLREKIISSLHDSTIGGHSGINETYQRLKSMFYWVNMKDDAVRWVQSCDVCQRSKAEHMPYPGLLQPLPLPNQAWTSISMDFIEGLPRLEGKDCIMVVVDRLTKYAHFLPLTHLFTTEVVARTFMDQVYRLHGLPVNIISDRDKIFTSTFWKELFRLLGTTLSLSTAYHLQTDGQTERMNQYIENYLRCMCHLRPNQWNKWRSLVEYWYNTNFHTGLKLSPLQALYGYLPGPLTIDPYIPTCQPDVEECLSERSKLLELLKLNLADVQNRMKVYADKHRTERKFTVGDYVYLKLQPYRQNSL
ncbi:Transposon Tf2-11 polyprotein [Sesamum angolense]|uniref:Transposon Tf2-11 polyprotein n=1 Tax=Sesamum angolense TaxID=2727404 RepID=A0AAE1WBK9_9LAMI|nr:Transposon Tf2-11 polyprotein [Sesamum angolense]